MNSVEQLEKTTFSGRRFTRQQLAEVQETVQLFPHLSRKELAQTLCEHLNWKAPNGANKIHSCYALLEALEKRALIRLPAKRKTAVPVRQPATMAHPEQDQPLQTTLSALGPIELVRVTTPEDRQQWRAYVQQYHYLGYRQAFGSQLWYWIVAGASGQKLGCLLFSASAAWALEARDQWIGWEKSPRPKPLHLILSNDRFLIFPWIQVPHLASHVLGLATRRLGEDWWQVYGYRPILIETFVDPARYAGTCYQAANWHYVGQTKGRGPFDPQHRSPQSVKDIYVYPLVPDWRYQLLSGYRQPVVKKKYRHDLSACRTHVVDEAFVTLWETVAEVLATVADEYDARWQVRRRRIDSRLLMLMIFRLVCSHNRQGYGTTLDELWDNCERLHLSLPQKSVLAPSSFCEARQKLDEAVFQTLNQRILAAYAQHQPALGEGWLGHRLLAVDGSKINLPRELAAGGFPVPSENAHYPQGLVSCLYQLQSQLPVDFLLVAQADERACAKRHLAAVQPGDVVVYDRGYFSYELLYRHQQAHLDAIFRLQADSYQVIREFFASPEPERLVRIAPTGNRRTEIRRQHPDLEVIPIPLRLLKYPIGDELFCLGTTLLDSRYRREDFPPVYHSRWGIEELYKVSKRLLLVEEFHAKNERGVKQELYAHFVLITLNRLFTNQADGQRNGREPCLPTAGSAAPGARRADHALVDTTKTNFKNCLHVFARTLEALLFWHAELKTAVEYAYVSIAARFQKARPGRSYPRQSMKPDPRWRPGKKRKKTIASTLIKRPLVAPT